MATRPVFLALDAYPWVQSEMITFEWTPGMTKIEKQANIAAIHKQAQTQHPQIKLLEVSSKSTESLGKALSAFNLQVPPNLFNLSSTRSYLSVECIYQSSKIFEHKGERKGPFQDLLTVSSKMAKQDKRLKESGSLIAFNLAGDIWSLTPESAFYNWLYCRSLFENDREPFGQILSYDGFTDIEFNPKKSISNQAYACALFIALHRSGRLAEAMESKEQFLRVVYADHDVAPLHVGTQMNLFVSAT